MQTQEDMVKHQWAPITLAAIFAYMIVDCFIGVYGVNLKFSSIFFLAKYVVKLENYGSSTNASEIRMYLFFQKIFQMVFYASRTCFFSFEFFSLSSCELEIFLFHYALKIQN